MSSLNTEQACVTCEELSHNSPANRNFNVLVNQTPFSKDTRYRFSRSLPSIEIQREIRQIKSDTEIANIKKSQPNGILKKGLKRRYFNPQAEKASQALCKKDLTYELKWEKLALYYLVGDENASPEDTIVEEKLSSLIEPIQEAINEYELTEDHVFSNSNSGELKIINKSLALYLLGRLIVNHANT